MGSTKGESFQHLVPELYSASLLPMQDNAQLANRAGKQSPGSKLVHEKQAQLSARAQTTLQEADYDGAHGMATHW